MLWLGALLIGTAPPRIVINTHAYAEIFSDVSVAKQKWLATRHLETGSLVTAANLTSLNLQVVQRQVARPQVIR